MRNKSQKEIEKFFELKDDEVDDGVFELYMTSEDLYYTGLIHDAITAAVQLIFFYCEKMEDEPEEIAKYVLDQVSEIRQEFDLDSNNKINKALDRLKEVMTSEELQSLSKAYDGK